MKLADALGAIESLRHNEVVAARRPFGPEAEAVVCSYTDDGGIPDQVKKDGFAYFLDAMDAEEALEVFAFQGRVPTPEEKVLLLLYYGEFDSFPQWVYGE